MQEFEKRGVTIKLLQSVRDYAIGKNSTEGYWTIGRLSAVLNGNHEILKTGHRWGSDVVPEDTLTFSEKCSLIDLLKKNYPKTPHPVLGVSYKESVGRRANVFLSFAYTSDFSELVNSVENYLLKNPHKNPESTYFWFDVFVNDQWVALEKTFEWWAQ